MRAICVLYIVSLLALAGCQNSQKAESKQAVQKAIEAYLAQRQNLMLANMNMEVGEVNFQGESADAEVKFRSKQSSNLVVSVSYKLKRHGDVWQVESSTPAGGSGSSPHGGLTPAAPGVPPREMPLESSH